MGEVYKAKETKKVQLNVIVHVVTLPWLPSAVMT